MSMDSTQKIIVFLDIDGTLIGYDQQPTTPLLLPYLRALEAKGVCFGLNSNRAYEDVLPIIATFGLKGPFILENGAYVLTTQDASREALAIINDDIPTITETVLRKIVQSVFDGAAVQKIDTTDLIISGQAQPSSLTFFMNTFRRFSASIHHRTEGTYDPAIAHRLAVALNSYFQEQALHLFAQAHEHGATVTVEIPGVDKGTALAQLRTRYPNTIFVAIGDGQGDVSLRPHVDRLYAVANAIPALRAVADKTATTPITEGVLEILKTEIEPLLA